MLNNLVSDYACKVRLGNISVAEEAVKISHACDGSKQLRAFSHEPERTD